jgi:phosphate acetyltransferase
MTEEAVGPIVQGVNKPYCDLSRGCSVDDMINVAAICSLMA